MESSTNISEVCEHHAPRPSAQAQAHADAFYVGKHVKKTFMCQTTGRQEHMWVRVDSAVAPGLLEGVLDNEPVLNVGFKCGDTLRVVKDEIEEVWNGQA